LPYFSVIIPTYNRSKFIKKAIDSVLNQTFKDFELIVVDDGSTDETSFILEEYENKIIPLKQANLGVSKARNRGLKKAQGKYLAFLDSDDVWMPEKLEEHYLFIQKHPKILIHQTDEIWFRNGKRVNPKFKHLKQEGNIFLPSLDVCLISPSAVVIKKSLLDKYGLFDESLPACEDYDLWLRITKSEKVGLIDKKLLLRQGGHPDQLSSSFWGMDRFRVYSILKLLTKFNYELKKNYLSGAREVALTKAVILREGALRRGKKDFVEKIDRIIKMINDENYNYKYSLFLLEE